MKNTTSDRIELKYYINYIDYINLKSKISSIFCKDENSTKDGQYYVRSLYFDNKSDNSYYEKIHGIENRKKYRIRIYNLDPSLVKLEIKTKMKDIIFKESTNIDFQDIRKIISGNYKCLLSYKNKTAEKIYYEFSKDFYKPVIIIDYKRDAWYLDLNNIRITFDSKIKKDEINLNELFDNNKNLSPVLRNSKIIMEIKYNGNIPSWIKKILQVPRLERCAISKYTLSRYLGI